MTERYGIRAILADPAKRRALLVQSILAMQHREGILTTIEQAENAYDTIQKEQQMIRRVTFTPSRAQERTALSRWSEWVCNFALAPVSVKGKQCRMVWPLADIHEGRWVPVENIEIVRAKEAA